MVSDYKLEVKQFVEYIKCCHLPKLLKNHHYSNSGDVHWDKCKSEELYE